MKVTKLVLGIIMIILGVIIFFQSMLVGVGNAIEASNSHSGASGIFVAVLYIATGIVYIATRKMEKMGGDIAGLVMMIIVWLLGAFNVGIYKDLQVWAWLGLILGVMFFVWHLLANRKEEK
ncbi:hypothetical protein [Limosilactobacillus sp.]|uniref:hypothetical protein n=1 Tax=Limosilactobacillus sp. TaxID=2773925 RepID=UPI00345E14BA